MWVPSALTLLSPVPRINAGCVRAGGAQYHPRKCILRNVVSAHTLRNGLATLTTAVRYAQPRHPIG